MLFFFVRVIFNGLVFFKWRDIFLEVFWSIHDPTTLDMQSADVGTQYRSVIYYHDDIQREKAENYKQRLNESKIWPDPVITEISSLVNYFKAEDHHQE